MSLSRLSFVVHPIIANRTLLVLGSTSSSATGPILLLQVLYPPGQPLANLLVARRQILTLSSGNQPLLARAAEMGAHLVRRTTGDPLEVGAVPVGALPEPFA